MRLLGLALSEGIDMEDELNEVRLVTENKYWHLYINDVEDKGSCVEIKRKAIAKSEAIRKAKSLKPCKLEIIGFDREIEFSAIYK